jgi:hypothetical protein
MPTDQRPELYESIPWDALVTDDAKRRRRWLSIVAAALVLGALSAAIARNLPSSGDRPVASTPSTVPVTTTVTTPVAAASDGATAAAVAVWFLSDYFTLDGTDITRRSLVEMLPDHVVLPEPASDERSFVETVIPVVVERGDEPGVHRVVAVVRMLTAPDGSEYLRQPARAVELWVRVTDEGVGVLDLPRPVPMPDIAVPALDLEPGDPPQTALEQALEEAALWGTPDLKSVSAETDGERWRIVVTVEDAGGLRWPVAGWYRP